MKKVLICLCLIIFGFGIGFGSNYFYSKQVSKPNKESSEKNVEKENSEDIEVDSPLVTNLMDIFHVFDTVYSDGGKYWGYFYQKDKYTVDTIDNQVKLLLGYLKQRYLDFGKNDTNFFDEFVNCKDCNEVYYEISKETLKKQIENIFGKDTSYQDMSFNGGYNNKVIYDENTGVYKINRKVTSSFGGFHVPIYYHKIVKAVKYEDRLEITEKMFFAKGYPYSIYKSTEIPEDGGDYKGLEYVGLSKMDENGIESLDDTMEAYEEQLNSYKYTFKYEKGNYYLNSVELVK